MVAITIHADQFQFTPLHERQHSQVHTSQSQCLFQFTPLHERQRGKGFGGTLLPVLFQFTPLHERQLIIFVHCYLGNIISIHAST